MKYFGSLIIISLLFISACKNENSSEQISNGTTAQFKVWGNCEMCKETIEGSLKIDGVSKADWNTETKQILVTYDSSKISLDQIQHRIADAGYDNEKYKSDEKVYHSLPECCQYERK
jgi:copper chaperone CopZ